MKKTIFPLLLGAILMGCTNEDLKNEGPGQGKYEQPEVTGYLAINLVAPGGLSTKAGDGEYQYGDANENYVQEVRLFFFDKEGNGVEIRKNPIYGNGEGQSTDVPEYFSYYDWSPTSADNNNLNGTTPDGTETENGTSGDLGNETVEKILSVMVMLTAKPSSDGTGTVFPSQVIAVVNPNQAVRNITLNNPTPNLKAIQQATSDFLTNQTSKGTFMMSNSVYKESSEYDPAGALIVGYPITSDNLQYTQPLAQDNPLTIYVERVLARMNMNMNITYADAQWQPIDLDGDGVMDLYPTQTKVTTEDLIYDPSDPTDTQLNDEPIYVKFLGWNLCSTPTLSYLVKNIYDWGGYNVLFSDDEPWYIYQYHRSFWGINPVLKDQPAENDYVWFTYNQLSGLAADAAENAVPMQGLAMNNPKTYMHENANPNGNSPANPAEPTKVIFAAQLCDSEGNAQTIAEWNGVYFTLQGLKNLASQRLDMYYLEPGTGTGDIPANYLPIKPAQITFITRSKFLGQSPLFVDDQLNYTVYATLTTAGGTQANDPMLNAAGLQWFHLNDNVKYENAKPSDYTQISSSSINSYIETVFGDASIWNNGYTYYYFTIKHFGTEDSPAGLYGVVRNHIYASTVTKLKGLGTPVWDPNEEIYPEEPDDHGNNISAQIKVLAWRVVNDTYDFDW